MSLFDLTDFLNTLNRYILAICKALMDDEFLGQKVINVGIECHLRDIM